MRDAKTGTRAFSTRSRDAEQVTSSRRDDHTTTTSNHIHHASSADASRMKFVTKTGGFPKRSINHKPEAGMYAYVRGVVRTGVLEPKPSLKHEKVSQCVFLGYPKKRPLCSPAFFTQTLTSRVAVKGVGRHIHFLLKPSFARRPPASPSSAKSVFPTTRVAPISSRLPFHNAAKNKHRAERGTAPAKTLTGAMGHGQTRHQLKLQLDHAVAAGYNGTPPLTRCREPFRSISFPQPGRLRRQARPHRRRACTASKVPRPPPRPA